MNKTTNSLITALVVLGVLVGAFFIIRGNTTGATVSEEVAKYIGEHAVLYVQTGCIHCKEQEDLFGENVKYLHIFDCAANTDNALVCDIGGITATPTWIINNQKYVGVQSIEKLKELTGYK